MFYCLYNGKLLSPYEAAILSLKLLRCQSPIHSMTPLFSGRETSIRITLATPVSHLRIIISSSSTHMVLLFKLNSNRIGSCHLCQLSAPSTCLLQALVREKICWRICRCPISQFRKHISLLVPNSLGFTLGRPSIEKWRNWFTIYLAFYMSHLTTYPASFNFLDISLMTLSNTCSVSSLDVQFQYPKPLIEHKIMR